MNVPTATIEVHALRIGQSPKPSAFHSTNLRAQRTSHPAYGKCSLRMLQLVCNRVRMLKQRHELAMMRHNSADF